MGSETIMCNGYYAEHGNSAIGNCYSQNSSGNSNVSHSKMSTNSGNTASSPVQNSRQQQNPPTSPAGQWNEAVSHQQQQQQQQQHQQQQQQHHQQQQQQSQHHQQMNPTHQQQHQQQLEHNNLPTSSNSHHNLFNNFHQRINSSWNIPNIACYNKMYNESHYQNFHQSPSGNGGGNGGNADSNVQRTDSNLTNHQHQHSSKRFGPQTGKSGNSKDICGDDKFKEDGDPWNVEAQAAFLGPNLWDKTLPYDADLKVTQYADLDEFLSENNIPDGLPGTHLGHSTSLGHRSDSLGHSAGLSLGLGHVTTKRERSPSPSDCVSPDTLNPPSPAESTFSFASSGRDFDPRTRAFSDEELKPQPMIKKSRKQFVPDELKDDKYWARRRKNNIAAKRSRDARRQKENQIAMRARYLEKENSTLHQEVEQLKQENMELRARLSKYQEV